MTVVLTGCKVKKRGQQLLPTKKLNYLLLQVMNFKLSQKAIASINEKYSEKIQKLASIQWHLSTNSCGCSGDCGSNWMRS